MRPLAVIAALWGSAAASPVTPAASCAIEDRLPSGACTLGGEPLPPQHCSIFDRLPSGGCATPVREPEPPRRAPVRPACPIEDRTPTGKCAPARCDVWDRLPSGGCASVPAK